MQQRLDQLKGVRDEKEAAVVGEIEGAVGSGVPGHGPAAERKQQGVYRGKAAYKQAAKELGRGSMRIINGLILFKSSASFASE